MGGNGRGSWRVVRAGSPSMRFQKRRVETNRVGQGSRRAAQGQPQTARGHVTVDLEDPGDEETSPAAGGRNRSQPRAQVRWRPGFQGRFWG